MICSPGGATTSNPAQNDPKGNVKVTLRNRIAGAKRMNSIRMH